MSQKALRRPLPGTQKLALSSALSLLLFGAAGCENKPSSGVTPEPSMKPTSVADAGRAPAASASAAAPVDKDPLAALSLGTIFRDDEDLTLDGVKENWRLEWAKAPVPECMAADTFYTCPCDGFAFGEKGTMDLVRTVPGKPDERLRLDPLFSDKDTIMQRWPVLKSDRDNALAADGELHAKTETKKCP
jgi:hypothetical protein